MIRDFAGNERHGAAARADVKRGCSSFEGVLGHERGIANSDRQPGFWVGCPDTTVLDAERTAACARRNLRGISFPFELERDITAVTLAFDDHTDLRPMLGGTPEQNNAVSDAFTKTSTR